MLNAEHTKACQTSLQYLFNKMHLNVGHSEGKPYGLCGPWARLPGGPGLLEIFVVVVVSPTLDLYSTHPPHFCEYDTPFTFLPKVFHPKRQHNSLCILISLCVSDNMAYPLMSLSITYTYPHTPIPYGSYYSTYLKIMVFAKNLEEEPGGSIWFESLPIKSSSNWI